MNSQEDLQQIQILEQGLQNILMQKQAFQMELDETQNALEQIELSGEEIFKMIGQLMLKTEKSKVKEELENKKKIIELRLQTLDKQESSLQEQIEKSREKTKKEDKE